VGWSGTIFGRSGRCTTISRSSIGLATSGPCRPRWPRSRPASTSAPRNRRATKVRFVIEVGGEVIGECSLHFFDDYARACHLGISIRRDKWGQGYGQDAVRTLVEYAFTYLNFRKVSLEVLADDERAVAVYSKAGFREEGRFREHNWHDGAYRDVLRMAVFRR
jgi:RimJ/RimL family protein N-acetyltransferase